MSKNEVFKYQFFGSKNGSIPIIPLKNCDSTDKVVMGCPILQYRVLGAPLSKAMKSRQRLNRPLASPLHRLQSSWQSTRCR
mgnify:CR=1 FL=1